MKTFKLTYVLLLVFLVTTFSCNNDDDGAETIVINVQNFTTTIDENPTSGQSVGTIETDGDGTLNFSITSQAPAGAFSINATTGELVVADASLFDFETNPVLTATITVEGAANTATVSIDLNDLEEISAEDVTIAIDENPTNGQSIDTIEVEGEGTLSFTIATQTPAGAISIDESTGELTVVDAALFDFETNPVITATISIDNSVYTVTAAVTINLNDLDEITAQNLTVAVDENPIDGQVVGVIQVTGGGTLDFNITSQTPTGALSINATTGELSVVDPNVFDFETNPVITATISVDNGVSTATATATINLNDVDEIVVQAVTLDIAENPTNGDVIGTLPATSSGSLTFTITYQNPAGAVNIDQNTGELSVADATLFDFETNPNMLAVISVDNGVYSVSANASIALENVNEVGDFNYGGVIFWLDASTNNNSGLVCAVSDQSNNIGASWGSNTPTIGNVATAIGTGQANTNAILVVHTQGTNAAKLCNSYTGNGFSDWYLPSKDELNEVYNNKAIIQATSAANGGANFKNSAYWTSSEHAVDPTRALNQFFNFGSQNSNQKGAIFHVRAIRTFSDL